MFPQVDIAKVNIVTCFPPRWTLRRLTLSHVSPPGGHCEGDHVVQAAGVAAVRAWRPRLLHGPQQTQHPPVYDLHLLLPVEHRRQHRGEQLGLLRLLHAITV